MGEMKLLLIFIRCKPQRCLQPLADSFHTAPPKYSHFWGGTWQLSISAVPFWKESKGPTKNPSACRTVNSKFPRGKAQGSRMYCGSYLVNCLLI